MRYMFVKLPQPCGCIFAAKMWAISNEDLVVTREQIRVPGLEPDTRPKIIWVYVHPECKQVEHVVEYP